MALSREELRKKFAEMRAQKNRASPGEKNDRGLVRHRGQADRVVRRVLPENEKPQPEVPYSKDAEMGVLSSMMQLHDGAGARDKARSKLTPDHFLEPRNHTIFHALCEMIDKGIGIDSLTVSDFLEGRKLLKPVGGRPYITELSTFVPSAVNIEHYINIVLEKFKLREIMATCRQGLLRAQEVQADPDGTLEFVRQKVEAIGLNGTRPTIQSVSELIAKPIEVKPDVIDGVLREGGKMAVGGSSKTKKT